MAQFDRRFLESTRGQVLALLRRGPRTIDELARSLGVSDNAVRAHISALERDRLVRRSGVRPTGGKPAFAYEVAPDAERLFTRAYIPVLTELVRVLEHRLGPSELEGVLREVGRRLAAPGAATAETESRESSASSRGDPRSRESTRARTGESAEAEADRSAERVRRAQAAATVLSELGGVVDVEMHDDGRLVLRGHSCPLADAVRAHPATCQAAESLVAEIVGARVTERCDRGERPRCCFEIETADEA